MRNTASFIATRPQCCSSPFHIHPSPLPERSPIPIFIQEHYLLIALSCQHLSSLFPFPDATGSIKCKLFSRAYQLELCSLTFNVTMFHPQSQLSFSLLVSLPSSILCLHGFSFSTNFLPNYLPSTSLFFLHLCNPSPHLSPLKLGYLTRSQGKEKHVHLDNWSSICYDQVIQDLLAIHFF